MAESGGSIGEQESVGRRLQSPWPVLLQWTLSPQPSPTQTHHTHCSPPRISHSSFLPTHGCQTQKCREIWTHKNRLLSSARWKDSETFLLSLRSLRKCQGERIEVRGMKWTCRNLAAWNRSLWSVDKQLDSSGLPLSVVYNFLWAIMKFHISLAIIHSSALRSLSTSFPKLALSFHYENISIKCSLSGPDKEEAITILFFGREILLTLWPWNMSLICRLNKQTVRWSMSCRGTAVLCVWLTACWEDMVYQRHRLSRHLKGVILKWQRDFIKVASSCCLPAAAAWAWAKPTEAS